MMRRRAGRPGLIGTAARTAVIAGTATAVSNKVSMRQAEKAQQQAYEQQAAAAPAPAPAPAPAADDDMIEKLKELAQLKDQGILTEEEFAAQKARILNA